MLSFLPPVVCGTILVILIGLNTVIMFVPIMLMALLKLLIPLAGWQKLCGAILIMLAEAWISVNNFSLWLTQKLDWDVQGVQDLDRDGWYLVCSNHQSWADILILQRVFHRRIPFMKFFLKQELIKVPFLGLGWWALDFPFMKRYTRAEIEKNPELRGTDLDTTRKACEKFKHNPIAIFNFMEGTRFTPFKHERQQSPYQHLLKPKAGGTAFVLGALGEQLHTMLNVTVVYPEFRPGIWEFLCGKTSRIIVRVEILPIPQEFLGRDYQADEAFRALFRDWVADLWLKKDAYIGQLLAEEQERQQKRA